MVAGGPTRPGDPRPTESASGEARPAPTRDALPAVTIHSIEAEPLSIPLREPFVIATGRIEVTRAVLVRATLEDAAGRRAVGLGEAAALPPVTREDQPELLAMIGAAATTLRGARLAALADTTAAIARVVPDCDLARAGIESAVVDAWARLAGVPLALALGGGPLAGAPAAPATPAAPGGHGDRSSTRVLGDPPGAHMTTLFTDITLPISAPAHMAATAIRHHDAGFSCFKVKVGRDWRADRAALRAVAAAVPDARFRLDANAGFTAADALALLDAALSDGLTVECFEQPCATDDIAGMAEVTARSSVPVVADESFRGAADLDRLIAARAAHGVNLKLVKLGGPLAALALGRRARAAGLQLMAGAMVETRVGLLAMAHVVAALGGVDWVDLDTAFLLSDDPFVGGWTVSGPHIELTGEPGLGVRSR